MGVGARNAAGARAAMIAEAWGWRQESGFPAACGAWRGGALPEGWGAAELDWCEDFARDAFLGRLIRGEELEEPEEEEEEELYDRRDMAAAPPPDPYAL
jgi:hypothetical protein